ncbi:MAG: hypothetical protein OXN25_00815 [Candidatus Poribacteria bacterium]|nr:hypothetical protein [Candidatus Poribacteria bacterium]MYK19424.1 hypothetical protein [Candidatus Poribacteria bacterium]
MRLFMTVAGVLCAATLALLAPTADAANKVDVFIYTDTVQWIGQAAAVEEAEILADLLDGQDGIGELILHGPAKTVEAWTKDHTVDNGHHLIVMFGDVPVEIYDVGKDAKKETVAEEFLDAGNTFSNSADYFFWGQGGRNEEAGIKNMMDIPNMVQWDDNTAMEVTKEGKELTPTLDDYATDRPFHVDKLDGDWVLEIAFASDTGDQKADRCDPCIVHNTKTNGRLIQVYQTANQDDPKGEVIAEIILNYYLETVGALDVDPQDKLPALWGDMKRRR